ncbi:MAG: aldo/keto reductase [Balneolaceae bacterium]|nr:aldo/keto reductase [Balneolaceae bacterium]
MDKKIRKIGLGTVQFGIPYGISNKSGQTSPDEVSKILETAQKKEIQFIDTASAYGTAEKVLGRHDLTSFKVISKFMPPEEGASVNDQFKKTLSDLGIPSLYGYLAHRPLNLAENLHQWEELNSFKENGKVEKIGFSLDTPAQLKALLNKGIKPDIIQAPFNYFDRRFKELMIALKKDGCEIHSRSAFLQGLFFMNVQNLDSHFEEVFPLLEQLQKSMNNLPGSLLNFVLDQTFIDTVIVGVENHQQFIENLKSVSMFDPLPKMQQDISDSILIPSNWPK